MSMAWHLCDHGLLNGSDIGSVTGDSTSSMRAPISDISSKPSSTRSHVRRRSCWPSRRVRWGDVLLADDHLEADDGARCFPPPQAPLLDQLVVASDEGDLLQQKNGASERHLCGRGDVARGTTHVANEQDLVLQMAAC